MGIRAQDCASARTAHVEAEGRFGATPGLCGCRDFGESCCSHSVSGDPCAALDGARAEPPRLRAAWTWLTLPWPPQGERVPAPPSFPEPRRCLCRLLGPHHIPVSVPLPAACEAQPAPVGTPGWRTQYPGQERRRSICRAAASPGREEAGGLGTSWPGVLSCPFAHTWRPAPVLQGWSAPLLGC